MGGHHDVVDDDFEVGDDHDVHSETRFVEAYNETGVSLAELIPSSTNVGAQVLVLRILVLIIFFSFPTFPV